MGTDLPVVAKTGGNGGVKTPHTRAKDYQLESLAEMAVMGFSPERMAAESDLPESYVNNLLRGGQNKKFDKLREQHRERVTTLTVHARYGLYDFLDDSLVAIGNAIRGNDTRLAVEQGRWLLNELAPNPNAPENGGGDQYSITFNSPHVQAQIGQGITNMTNMFGQLREAVAKQVPGEHVLMGTDALPIPPSQLEVTAGEALPEPGSSPDDFPMEAIEEKPE